MVKVTLRTAAEHWYAYGETERNWKPPTRRDYRSCLDAHLLPALVRAAASEHDAAFAIARSVTENDLVTVPE